MSKTNNADAETTWNPRSVELLRLWLRHGGVASITASGGSMLPTYRAGDRLVVEHVSTEDISIGDVIAFFRDGRVIAHRVVRIDQVPGGGIATRGDSRDVEDLPIHFPEIVGRVVGGERSAAKLALWRAVRRMRSAVSRAKRLIAKVLRSIAQETGAPR